MCTIYDMIIFFLFNREFGANAVFAIALHLRKLKRFDNLEWLTVIPLLDFLKGYSTPFARPEMNPEKIHWVGVRERELQLYELKGKAGPGYVYSLHYSSPILELG